MSLVSMEPEMVLALQEADMLAPGTPPDAPVQGPEVAPAEYSAFDTASIHAIDSAVVRAWDEQRTARESDPRGLKLQEWLRGHGFNEG